MMACSESWPLLKRLSQNALLKLKLVTFSVWSTIAEKMFLLSMCKFWSAFAFYFLYATHFLSSYIEPPVMLSEGFLCSTVNWASFFCFEETIFKLEQVLLPCSLKQQQKPLHSLLFSLECSSCQPMLCNFRWPNPRHPLLVLCRLSSIPPAALWHLPSKELWRWKKYIPLDWGLPTEQ